MKVRKSIYIDANIWEYLSECAALNCRSENQFIAMLLKEWVDADILRGKEQESNEGND